MAVIIVQWEAMEVLSQMSYSVSKSSLPAKSSPGPWWGLVHLPPSWWNLQHDSCVLFHRPQPEAGYLPWGSLRLPYKLWSLGLHVLGETKAKTGTVVLSEGFPRPGSCCALVQSPYLGAVVMVEDMPEKKKQRMGSEKGRERSCAGATGRHREEEWRERVCRCSSLFCALIYHPGSSLSAETWLFGKWPKALMKACWEAQGVPGPQGALCVSRLSAFSEETHHHPALCWITAFEVSCLICVTASVTQHKTFSGFFLSLLQFHPPGITTRDETAEPCVLK